jgi:hypothetical protein
LTGIPFEDPATGNQIFFDGVDNPYWTLKNNTFNDELDRVIANVSLKYDIKPWLALNYRLGVDASAYGTLGYDQIGARGGANTAAGGTGGIANISQSLRDLNYYIQLIGNKNINKELLEYVFLNIKNIKSLVFLFSSFYLNPNSDKIILDDNLILYTDNYKNDVKLMLYRHCKNIYDKWLGGVTNIDNIIFQCGGATTDVDLGLMVKYRKNDVKTRLIDSFRFVDRAFRDIGDLFYINPTPVNPNKIPNCPK